jgi:hypothetical protein
MPEFDLSEFLSDAGACFEAGDAATAIDIPAYRALYSKACVLTGSSPFPVRRALRPRVFRSAPRERRHDRERPLQLAGREKSFR